MLPSAHCKHGTFPSAVDPSSIISWTPRQKMRLPPSSTRNAPWRPGSGRGAKLTTIKSYPWDSVEAAARALPHTPRHYVRRRSHCRFSKDGVLSKAPTEGSLGKRVRLRRAVSCLWHPNTTHHHEHQWVPRLTSVWRDPHPPPSPYLPWDTPGAFVQAAFPHPLAPPVSCSLHVRVCL